MIGNAFVAATGSVRVGRLCLVVFLAAFALRAGLDVLAGGFRDLQRTEMERVALSVAQRGAYADPFYAPTGPTAHVTPGYVLILACLFKLAGTGVAAEIVKNLLCCVASSLRSALVTWFGWKAGLDDLTVRLLAVLSVVWIGALNTEIRGDWEAPFTALLLLGLTILHWTEPIPRMRAPRAMLLGLLWGVAALFNPAVLAAFSAFALVEGIQAVRTRSISKLVRNTALAGACCLLVMTPWAVRNRMALGKWIATRDNLGLELWLSYRPGAHWSNQFNAINVRRSPHPLFNPDEAQRVREMGEVAYNELKRDEALTAMRAEPARALRLFSLHLLSFWFPVGRGAAHAAVLWAFAIGSIGGLLLLCRRRSALAPYVGALMAAYTAVYAAFNWSSRYRYPIEWAMVLATSVFVAALIGRARGRWSAPSPSDAAGVDRAEYAAPLR
jgi:hypothetical protein